MLLGILSLTALIWCGALSFEIGSRRKGYPSWGKWNRVFWTLAACTLVSGFMGAFASSPNASLSAIILYGVGQFIGFVILIGLVCLIAWAIGRAVRKTAQHGPR